MSLPDKGTAAIRKLLIEFQDLPPAPEELISTPSGKAYYAALDLWWKQTKTDLRRLTDAVDALS